MADKPKTKWTGLSARIGARHMESTLRRGEERALLDLALRDLDGDPVVVDLGAGTGFLTLTLARALPGGKVIAVDLSAEMLGRLAARASREHLSSFVEMREEDAAATGIAGGSAGVVVTAYLLHELGDPGAALREAYRVLRPGGRIVVEDFRDGLAGRLIGLMHGRECHGPLSPAKLERLLAEAGFRSVEVKKRGSRMIAVATKPARNGGDAPVGEGGLPAAKKTQ